MGGGVLNFAKTLSTILQTAYRPLSDVLPKQRDRLDVDNDIGAISNVCEKHRLTIRMTAQNYQGETRPIVLAALLWPRYGGRDPFLYKAQGRGPTPRMGGCHAPRN